MKKFGVKSAYGDLKSVIMHRPGVELDLVKKNTLREFNFSEPVNRELFIADYDKMLKLFQEQGVETLLLADILKHDKDALSYINHRPNMTYTRDLATVFSGGAVLLGPQLKGRWGDQRIVGRALKRLGIPILGEIEQPGFLEGGGVTMIGEDTVVTSLCDRANEVGTRALRQIVLGKEVKYFLEVPLPHGYIHIDGAFMVLDKKLCLIYPEAFRFFPCTLYEAGKSTPQYIMFEEFLDKKGVEKITINKKERDEGALNVVVTKRSKTAIGFQKAKNIASKMQKFGWEFHGFPQDELFKGRGGAHCMTCPLWVN